MIVLRSWTALKDSGNQIGELSAMVVNQLEPNDEEIDVAALRQQLLDGAESVEHCQIGDIDFELARRGSSLPAHPDVPASGNKSQDASYAAIFASLG